PGDGLVTGNLDSGWSVPEYALASFHSANPWSQTQDFTTRIHWGDGTTSDGSLVSNGNNTWDVWGGHHYDKMYISVIAGLPITPLWVEVREEGQIVGYVTGNVRVYHDETDDGPQQNY